jgi:uncharacterized lipoprotein YmbA
MKHSLPFCAPLLAVMLTACHSLPGPQYYALDTVAPHTPLTQAPAAKLIYVRHISLPHEMDHLGLTHHAGPTQLVISELDQWSAPLTDLIQGTITRDLGARLGYDHVVPPDSLPGARGTNPAALDLDFLSLSAGDTCGIDAQVNWTLSVPNGATRRGTIPLAAAATGCPAGLPTALSQALGDLADQLAPQLMTP